MMRPLIAVLDAAGTTGEGVVRALLSDPAQRFAVRALIGPREEASARALVRAGAQVRKADIDDEASLARAFAGAYGVFAAADIAAHLSPGREAAQTRNVARAARVAGVRHVAWSTTDDAGMDPGAFFLEQRLAATILQTPRGRDLPIGSGARVLDVFALGLITEVDTVIGHTVRIAGEHAGGVGDGWPPAPPSLATGREPVDRSQALAA